MVDESTIDALPRNIRSKITIDDATGCWEWTATKCRGYGQVVWQGGRARAHRVTYHLLVDPRFAVYRSDGNRDVLDHKCRNTSCVNPEHLVAVSQRQNVCVGISGEMGALRQSSIALGVHWHVTKRRWGASIRVNGRACHLGRYLSEVDAARMYDAARHLIDGCTPNSDRGMCPAPTADDVRRARTKMEKYA